MTDASLRVRNRLQDGVINWQEVRARKEGERQQHADIRRSRMTCSADLPGVSRSQDWTGSMPMTASGRLQVIRESQPQVSVISGDGIRRNVAVTALILVAVLLAAVLLADLAGIGEMSRNIVKLNGRITALENKNVELKQDLELSTDSATVCTSAVKMDLISSNGARTIRLTAPQEAQITLSDASVAAENADLEIRMMSYAGD